MLTELCGFLKNWFDRDQPKFYGRFIIENNEIISVNDGNMRIQEGQYYRIMGSIFNDGVYQSTEGVELKDETFVGSVWLMAVPNEVIQLAKDIEEWQAKYGGIDSQAMSPYTSESFGGYSYSKNAGSTADGSSLNGWQAVFASRLNRWRKI